MRLTTDILSQQTRNTVAWYLREYRKLMGLCRQWQPVYYAQQYWDGAQACKSIAAAFKSTGDFDALLTQCQYNIDSLHGVQRSWWCEARQDVGALIAQRDWLRRKQS